MQSYFLWYVKVNIFWKFIQCIVHWDKKNDKKIFLWNFPKNVLFFLSRAPTHYSFTFFSQFLYELKQKFHPSKTVCWIFHCWFRLVFSTKSMDPLTSKHHSSFQNKNNRKATHTFAPKPLIFKLQQEVWKFKVLSRSYFLNSNRWINIWHSFT